MQISDNDLIANCCKGHVASHKQLYERYVAYAYAIILRYARNGSDAEELLNDVFIKVFANIRQYKRKSGFRPWLRKIIVNTSIDYYRKSLSKGKMEPLYDQEPVMVKNHYLNELEAEDILKMIQSLPERYRLVFNLFEMEGYKHDEIAEMLGLEASSSRSLLSRAKKMLREMITREKKRLKNAAGY